MSLYSNIAYSRDATLLEMNRHRQEKFIREPNASKDSGRFDYQ